VKTTTAKTVAILGTRYIDLAIEERTLRPLGVQLVESPGQSEEEIVRAAAAAQVIVCGGAPKITAGVIPQLSELKAVIRAGIGIDTVDLEQCSRRGIYVANVPDYCVDEVATHALMLILAWTRRLPIARANMLAGRWEIASLKPLESPRDLVLGLLGFGQIAQSLCRMARAIGFNIWACDPYVPKALVQKRGAQPVTLRRLIRGADFVSLHLPLTAKTKHIINLDRLKEMKHTAYVINTARGELIDESALGDALSTGKIAGAALDVLEHEPPAGDHPLAALPNVIITPHCAWYTERSQQELRRKACAEVIRVLRGSVPKNLVNREVLR
jgi:D-3-phosphoglycerate dehydrogenase